MVISKVEEEEQPSEEAPFIKQVSYHEDTPRKEIVERTNYFTDDSDSDLDVIVDPNKAQVPKKFVLKDLTDSKKNAEILKVNPILPNSEDIP